MNRCSTLKPVRKQVITDLEEHVVWRLLNVTTLLRGSVKDQDCFPGFILNLMHMHFSLCWSTLLDSCPSPTLQCFLFPMGIKDIELWKRMYQSNTKTVNSGQDLTQSVFWINIWQFNSIPIGLSNCLIVLDIWQIEEQNNTERPLNAIWAILSSKLLLNNQFLKYQFYKRRARKYLSPVNQ